METNAKMVDGYVFFWSGPFSNFHPCKVIYNGKEFSSSEHMFMYLKAEHFKDNEAMEGILKAKAPKEAKAIGRTVKSYNDKEWEKHRVKAMKTAVIAKFSQNKMLKYELLDRKYDDCSFVEASPFDRIWGIGYDADHAMQAGEDKWGRNLLGKVLDEVREEFMEKYGNRQA